MKNLIIICCLLMTVVFITSCERETDLNVDPIKQLQTIFDPNAKSTITPEQIKARGQQYVYSKSGGGGIIVLDFEGLGNLDYINEFYNGGTSSQGFSGTNYGVEFGNAVAGIDADEGGSGNFANEPSPSTAMSWLDANQAFMNVAAGFTTGFSFYYTSLQTGAVSVYDGLNGTGNLLGTANLTINWNINCTGDPTGDFCNWDQIAVPFEGTAKSVVFSGSVGNIGFDDVTFGSTTPGGGDDSDGDGCEDEDDEIIDSNMEATVTIDGCDSGVVNRVTPGSCGIMMSDVIDVLEAGTYKNHGQFVSAVADVVNGWFDAGLITLEEMDAIMSCAGQANIPN
ncbi:hypothetical protein FJ651_00195 [Paucihalobacter ruber]|uniref:Uncharacterized protein n=1 Tax=Paucihalobacter ruber TaxID=2567861 RepID=A0A506PQ69_9FLAO|nr:hypothetical protein [Paucihalobacter ruber]TPV35377.1 hypothetical protein FJ651_00195 [Paucihalobacter ruber]